ncbi:hypothetical protein GpartN1_g7185.t1 [Galdieria partita]|uniref:N-acetylgalactosaminide beta-1,3-galactosyltransferase n=1 Tax=Galdieria partita TaxID=83374 RepID=A0A9C7Q407_9RHOD|nr:hypothetical protein GpartN1_g7185.t1 [Galdieria partita]
MHCNATSGKRKSRHSKMKQPMNNSNFYGEKSKGRGRGLVDSSGVGAFWNKHYIFIVWIVFILTIAILWSLRHLYYGLFYSSPLEDNTKLLSDTDAAWNALSNRVAFAMKTGAQVIEDRFPNPNSTWLQRVKHYIIVSDQADSRYGAIGLKELFESVGLSLYTFLENRQPLLLESSSQRKTLEVTVDQANVGWWQDREKNLPGFHMLWKKFPYMDWYIMCDDDTFFFLDGLAAILQHPIFEEAMREEIPIYMGNQYNVALCEGYDPSGVTNGSLNPWFAHGGSGIILNYWALEALIDMIPWCMQRFQDCWAGDIKVGLCFQELGLSIVPMGTHFIGVDPKSYFDTYYSQPPYKQSKGQDIVASFHHCDDEEFAFLFALEQQIAGKNKQLIRFKHIAELVSPSFQFPQ